MKILYVEDNMANLFLVKRVAKMGNHEVINYIDGAEALEHLQRDQPDLVLMDIQLAGEMNGLDVVKKMRKDGHKMPVIAVTAYAMLGDRERCMQSGCDDYLAKPLPIAQLSQIFERYAQKMPVVQEVTVQPLEPVAPPPEPVAVPSEPVANAGENPPSVADKKEDTADDEDTSTAVDIPSATQEAETVASAEVLNSKREGAQFEETLPSKPHLNGTARNRS